MRRFVLFNLRCCFNGFVWKLKGVAPLVADLPYTNSPTGHRGFACTKPPSRAVSTNKYLSKRRCFVCYSYREIRPFLKRAWQGLSCWKSHVFKSWPENMTFSAWPNDFTHCGPQLSESPCHALFRTGLVFTEATTKIKVSALKKNISTFFFWTDMISYQWPTACLQLDGSVHIVIKVHLLVLVVPWSLYK